MYAKRQAKRIDMENQKLMVRIITSESTLNIRKMNESYNKMKEFKKRHATKVSLEIAERLIEKGDRLREINSTEVVIPGSKRGLESPNRRAESHSPVAQTEKL